MISNYNIKAIVSELSFKEQILELLMLDVRYFTDENEKVYPVTTLPREMEEVLAEYPLGGVILFRENLVNLHDILRLTDKLQQNARFGRLIAIDQEGGSVTRIHNATEMPGNMALGAINNLGVTSQASQILAKELDALGFNFMFSPVLDVNSNPQNPIVGVRSFGKDPLLVAKHGVAYCDGLNREGLIPCGKHFPGHGDTDCDSHHDLPTIDKAVVEFNKVDLLPFEYAIEAKIDSIMTAHIVFPNIDNGKIVSNKTGQVLPIPATLSSKILTGLLRNKMKYNGVIVSDALDMRAISDNFTPVEATINCIAAGVDLVLMPIRLWSKNHINEFKSYVTELVAECEKSKFLKQRIFESCCRILELKHRKVLPKLLSQAGFESRLKYMEETVFCKKHQEMQEQIASRAITLLENFENTLPWTCNTSEKIMLIAANEAVSHDAGNALSELGYANVVIKTIEEISPDVLDNTIARTIVLTYNLTPETATKFNTVISSLKKNKASHIVLSCHNPYDSLYLDNSSTNVLAFGCSGLDQTNYSIRKFELNMNQAIKKIMTATSICEFNSFSPV